MGKKNPRAGITDPRESARLWIRLMGLTAWLGERVKNLMSQVVGWQGVARLMLGTSGLCSQSKRVCYPLAASEELASVETAKKMKIRITEKRLRAVLLDASELGYFQLDSDERAICDAFDSGRIEIIPQIGGSEREQFAERSAAYC